MVERSLSQARDELSELANRVGFGGERVVLTRRGRPVAVLVSLADLAALESPPVTVPAVDEPS